MVIRIYHISVILATINKERWCIKLYKKFQDLLVKNDTTPYRVHKDTGISTATLSDWKRGRSTPKVDKLLILSNYFNVPLEYFLEEETTKQ